MGLLLTPVAERLLALEAKLRGPGIPAGGQGPSRATFKRDLRILRAEMAAVVDYDPFEARYVLRNRDWRGVWPHIIDELHRAP